MAAQKITIKKAEKTFRDGKNFLTKVHAENGENFFLETASEPNSLGSGVEIKIEKTDQEFNSVPIVNMRR